MKYYLVILLFTIIAYSCNAQHTAKTTDWQQLIPNKSLPSVFKIRKSNNNVDITLYKGRYYVAFRTGKTHFASRKISLYVMSSVDFQKWDYETKFELGNDIREPRFVIYKDSLYLYFFEGGNKLLHFQPKHIWQTATSGNQKWTEKQTIQLDGWVPWRLKVRNDTLYLSAYYGTNIYKYKHQADLRLFVSTDALNFQPISKESQVSTKGAEEAEFEFDKQGNLWATVRLEGSGSYIVYAHRDSLHHWHKTYSNYKYDSALMFEHQDIMYVLARRHVKGEASQTEHPTRRQRRRNLIRYSLSRKRTALYKLDKEARKLIHIMDFPSHGDNAFPAIAPINDESYYFLNYSNKIGKGDKKWVLGQLAKTYIYWTVLSFSKEDKTTK